MNPKARRLVLILLVVAAVGWQFAQSRLRAKSGTSASATTVAAAPDLLKLGTLTLEPCNIGEARAGAIRCRAS